MVSNLYIPERGDLIWLNFNPQAGHEQFGRRPAIVLSPTSYNKTVGLCIVCPITSKVKGYPFEVQLPEGLAIEGAILSDQVKNLDWKIRQADFISKLPDTITDDVLNLISTLLA
jgi:mRNA interferase MazF